MKLVLHIESRKLEGLRPPPIARSSSGSPILPRKGDTLAIKNKNGFVFLLVDEIVWYLDHDVDENVIAVYASEIVDNRPEGTLTHYSRTSRNGHSLDYDMSHATWQCVNCHKTFGSVVEMDATPCEIVLAEVSPEALK